MRGHYSDVWQEIARAFGDRPAVVTPTVTMTYERFARDAGALSGHLAQAGLRPGDSVVILL